MAEFSEQGSVSTTGTVLHSGSDNTVFLSKVLNIRFNNPVAYTLKLEKFEYATSTTSTIYNLSLSAGDTVTDNFAYALNPGDKLIARSNIVGTTYYIYGLN